MTNPSAGRFIWYDLMSKEPEKAVGFYSELFGYTVTEEQVPPGHTYRKLHAGDVAAAGIVPLEQPEIPSHWMAYIAVDDVPASIETVKSLGGRTHFGPIDVPGKTSFAIHGDPQGGTFTTMAPTDPASMPHATKERMRPGVVCWNELWTTDADAAVAFYGKLCGWRDEARDMGGGVIYHVQSVGDAPEDQVCGIMKAPEPDVPPYWCPYFLAPGVDERTEQAANLGAQVIVPCTDIPNGIGRFSVITDPTGACLALFQEGNPC